MSNGTLEERKVTISLEIARVEDQNSPRFQEYVKIMDAIFRRDNSREVLQAAGFVCMVAIDRSRELSREIPMKGSVPTWNWYRMQGKLKGGEQVGLRNLDHAEEILFNYHTGRLWKTYLRGQRHDYYFYSRAENIEETLDLIEVARVMVS
jgi:hypothetical protein